MVAICRNPLVQPYPTATAQCEHCQRRCLQAPVRLEFDFRRVKDRVRTVDIVLENGRFVDSRKITVAWVSGGTLLTKSSPRTAMTYPLVNTLSSEVFPHAPSPLHDRCRQSLVANITCIPCYGNADRSGHRGGETHSKTSLRCTVFEPPIPQGIVSGGGKIGRASSVSVRLSGKVDEQVAALRSLGPC